jgi:hypothetical protein
VTTLTQDPEVYEDQAALGLLLDHHPAHLSELARELAWPRHRVEDAVARRRRAGLAHLDGGLALPSRAALSFDRLGSNGAAHGCPALLRGLRSRVMPKTDAEETARLHREADAYGRAMTRVSREPPQGETSLADIEDSDRACWERVDELVRADLGYLPRKITARERITDGGGLRLFSGTPAGIAEWVRSTRPTIPAEDVAAHVRHLRDQGILTAADVAESSGCSPRSARSGERPGRPPRTQARECAAPARVHVDVQRRARRTDRSGAPRVAGVDVPAADRG